MALNKLTQGKWKLNYDGGIHKRPKVRDDKLAKRPEERVFMTDNPSIKVGTKKNVGQFTVDPGAKNMWKHYVNAKRQRTSTKNCAKPLFEDIKNVDVAGNGESDD